MAKIGILQENRKLQSYFDNLEKSNVFEAAKEYLRYKPFTERFQILKNIAAFGVFIFPSISITTGIFFLGAWINTALNIKALSFVIAALLLFGIEVGKYVSYNNAIPVYYLKKNLKGSLIKILIISSVILSIASFVFSFFGAMNFAHEIDTKHENIISNYSIKKDSINVQYSNLIKNEEKKYNFIINKPAWKGNYSKEQLKMLSVHTDNIKMLREEKNNKLNNISVLEKSKLNKAKKEVETGALVYAIIAAINELLLISCLIFTGFWKYKIIYDVEAHNIYRFEPNKYDFLDFRIESEKRQEIAAKRVGFQLPDKQSIEPTRPSEQEIINKQNDKNNTEARPRVEDAIFDTKEQIDNEYIICINCGK